jgi:hypothetical protein
VTQPDYFTDRSHVLIAGVTGARTDYGGKTALANWWCATHGREAFDVVIFGNFKHDDGPESEADVVATSVDEVAGAMGDGAEYICLSPHSADWEATTRRLRSLLEALGDDGGSKLVVLDEAPELDADALQWFVRVAGNGADCKALVLSQAPGDLPQAVRRQCILCWVGPVQENNRHVFRANARENHFDAMLEQHEPYHWSVITGPADDDRDHYEPVPEAYA